MQDQRALHLLQPLILSLCHVVLASAELVPIEHLLFILRRRRQQWRADASEGPAQKNCICFFLPPLLCISMSAQMSRDRRSARKDPYLCKCANVCVCESGIDPVRLVKKCRRFLSQMWTSRSVYVTGIFNVFKIPISQPFICHSVC